MPSEAQLKAQMQVAIAKKKRDLVGATRGSPSSPPIPKTPSVQTHNNTPLPIPILEPAKPEPSTETATPIATPIGSPPPPTNTTPGPISLTFYGHTIRYTTHRQQVYFAVIDLLALSKQPNYQNQFIEFKNNPKTKDIADPLINILTFPGPNGSEKIEGATATNILNIFKEMNLSAPGPMGRWLHETATTHRPKEA